MKTESQMIMAGKSVSPVIPHGHSVFEAIRWTSLLLLSIFTFEANAAELNVYAAASLTDVLKDLSQIYQKERGSSVVFNFGASSILARQIEEGAPADLFFSADEAKMDALENKGFLLSGTRKSLLSNQLVFVVPSDSSLEMKDVKDLARSEIRRIALSESRSVPVGIYAKSYLQKAKLWDKIVEKIVPTENVRASLAAVESGNVELGIVYKTDAFISKKVRIVYEVPLLDAPKISYPIAVMKDSKNINAAKSLIQFLEKESSKKIFRKFGFVVVGG